MRHIGRSGESLYFLDGDSSLFCAAIQRDHGGVSVDFRTTKNHFTFTADELRAIIREIEAPLAVDAPPTLLSRLLGWLKPRRRSTNKLETNT